MAVELIMPKTGYTLDEAPIVEWFKHDGDHVNKGEPVLSVESDKAVFDIEAPIDGFVVSYAKEGSIVSVGEAVGAIAVTKEEIDILKKSHVQKTAESASVEVTAEHLSSGNEVPKGEREAISPVARKLAAKYGLDIRSIKGSGPHGTITKADIEQAANDKNIQADQQDRRVAQIVPVVGLRKAIADHMVRSLRTAAQLTNMVEVDLSRLVEHRRNLISESEKSGGIRISYNDFLVKACALALRDHPIVNASFEENGIKIWQDINIGVSMTVEGGLFVPVIHNADQKSLFEINSILNELSKKARKRELKANDLSGGTFTVNNVGTLGLDYSTAILNFPEAAILTIGRIVQKPVVIDGKIVIGSVAGISLTYDHRVTDGVPMMSFFNTVIKYLQEPAVLHP